uniref:Hippurate hydrolase n=1 Tax=Candidatus Kentrum sp. TC TaxID=2126339 RepID=A0A451A0G8_9GAMM|nr:MAG: hippurate hydrolase [Candidatus Kentron sp. TC]
MTRITRPRTFGFGFAGLVLDPRTIVSSEINPIDPAIIDEDPVNRILPIFHRVVGVENVELVKPTMGGEDFGYYGRAGAPIFLWRVGAVKAERLAEWKSRDLPPPLHSPLFYPDAEETLPTSVAAMAAAALEMLQPERE